ncbi:MAG: SOS response-associated peptidase [Microbacterium sp.]
MCGRFVVARVGSELVSELRADHVADDLPGPSFNIAPTDPAAIVLDSAKTDPPSRRVERARWGLVPGWAKDLSVGSRAFNARSEGVEAKPLFRSAFRARRAVVPATGYYEWQKTGDRRIPHFVRPADESPLLLAGLYEWWKDESVPSGEDGRWVLSFTILTMDASDALAPLHPRMPVFLDAAHADAWLDPAIDHPRDVLDALVDDATRLSGALERLPVSSAVGSVRNDSPELITPVG